MPRFLSLGRWTPRAWDWPIVLLLGGMAGVAEGALYGNGPALPLWMYWTGFFGVVAWGLVGCLGVRHAMAFSPFTLVWQDAWSLHAQHVDPVTASWYEAVFGRNLLTAHWFLMPNWYYIGFGLTLGALFILSKIEAPTMTTTAKYDLKLRNGTTVQVLVDMNGPDFTARVESRPDLYPMSAKDAAIAIRAFVRDHEAALLASRAEAFPDSIGGETWTANITTKEDATPAPTE